MAYRKRAYKKAYKKRSGFSKKKSTLKRIKKTVSKLARRVEKKVFFHSDSEAAHYEKHFTKVGGSWSMICQGAPVIRCLNLMPVGLRKCDRDGAMVTITRVQGMFRMQFGSSITDDTWMHYKLIRAKGHWTADPTVTQLQDAFWGVGATAWQPCMLPNVTNRDVTKEWEVLDEGTFHHLHSESVNETATIPFGFRADKKASYARNNTVGTLPQATVIGDMDYGAIYFCLWITGPNSNSNEDAVFKLRGECQVFFVDS